jgi:starch phosphorylase
LNPSTEAAQAADFGIAYFSMEIAVNPTWPTYAGGLGVLAGDMLRSAADRALPVVAVSLLSRRGYFRQKLDASGNQTEIPENWDPALCADLQPLSTFVSVPLNSRNVKLRAWQYRLTGVSHFCVPVYFLDADLPENSAWDRALTGVLYGGDSTYRLCQEVLLGIGGVKLLRALGYTRIERFHMNEGHSALLALALLEEMMASRGGAHVSANDMQAVREQCVFTTHTPVPAAFDQFPSDLVVRVLGEDKARLLEETDCCHRNILNMTYLGLRCSQYVNGVAMHHGEISHTMFPNYPVHAITNGVHAVTWASDPFRRLYDAHIPEWRRDNLYLRYAIGISLGEIQEAHAQAKRELFTAVRDALGKAPDENVFTIGFARRATEYKRADFIFSDLDRLRAIARKAGPLQLIFGGKAHPADEAGKEIIRRIFAAAESLRETISIVYVENYDARWARLFTSGVDLWLNTPHRPFEASGTSGMKASLNGVPSLSVRDGWWVEGHFEGATGWSIGYEEDPERHDIELGSMYDKLERVILPAFYFERQKYHEIMRSTIALNGSFFNTQRMLAQYLANAYYPQPRRASANHPPLGSAA